MSKESMTWKQKDVFTEREQQNLIMTKARYYIKEQDKKTDLSKIKVHSAVTNIHWMLSSLLWGCQTVTERLIEDKLISQNHLTDIEEQSSSGIRSEVRLCAIMTNVMKSWKTEIYNYVFPSLKFKYKTAYS